MNKFQEMGYTNLRKVPGRGMCGVYRFLYTYGLVFNMNESGYEGRICFDNMTDCAGFLEEWDGTAFPQVGQDGVTAIKAYRISDPVIR